MNHTQTIRKLAHALIVCAMVTACGGGGGDAVMPSSIGPAGGTVTSAEGASVTIPAGALAAQVAIAVAKDSAGAPALPQGVQLAGDVFAFTPHGTSFALSAALAVPFDPARVAMGATLALMKTNAALTGWAPVAGATVSGSKMGGSISGFSFVAVVAAFAPTITQAPADQTVAIAQSATFSVAASANPGPAPLLYAWQSSMDGGATWTTIAGATNASYTTSAATVGDDGTRFRINVALQAVPFINVDSAGATLTVVAAGTAMPMVAAGTHHALALKADGTVWAWGLNDLGQLGNGSTVISAVPVQVSGLPAVRKVAAGHNHSLALATDGSVWAWGYLMGPLAQQMGPAGNFVDIAAAYGFSVALRDDGSVWTWGEADKGQLGRDTGGLDVDFTPAPVSGLANVTAISAGGRHVLALKSDGTVWAWGDNFEGEIGDGSMGPGFDRRLPVQVAALSGAVAVRAGDRTSFAVVSNGNQLALYSWGGGLLLALQVVTASPTPVVVSDLQRYASLALDNFVVATWGGGGSNTFILAIDAAHGGVVRGVGANDVGQLGNETTLEVSLDPASAATLVTGLVDVRGIDASRASTTGFALARKGDGTVWAWGYNFFGQLGDGSRTNRLVPVQVQGLNLR